MINIDAEEQKQHFDDTKRQYKWSRGIESTLAQSMEYTAIIEKLPTKKKELTIVDYGCGTGRISLFLLSQGINVVAVDISEVSLNKVAKLYKKYSSPGWGKLTTKTIIPSNKYDAIVGADVLHHVIIDNDLKMFKDYLKPHGIIVFSEPNAIHLAWYLHYFLNKIPFSIEKGILQCTYFNLRNKLRKHKYSNIDVSKHGLLPTPLFNKFPLLMRININILAKIPVLNLLCFRFIISANIS